MAVVNSVSFDEELKKNLNMRKEDIRKLSEWCREKENLSYKFTDSDLALFLHNNYYDVTAAKSNIENYHRMRLYLPAFFAERDPVNSKSLKNIFNTVTIIPLDKLTAEGHKVIFAKLIDTNSEKYIFADAIKYLNMVLDLCVYKEGTNNGYVFVLDVNGTTLEHCGQLSWLNLKKFFEYTKKGSPIRWKGLHYINSLFCQNSVQTFIKSKILGQKFADMIYFHNSFDKFNDIIPIEAFPDEMGGKAGPLMKLHELQINKLKSRQDWFLSMDLHMTNERKQFKKLNIADIFGEDLEFKELNID